MILLTMRTDKPEAEIGIFDNDAELEYVAWQAHRELAETIHIRIKELLDKRSYTLESLNGVIFFKGPGSFTGLRIGASVANTLAASLCIPIVGSSTERWKEDGFSKLQKGTNEQIILPEYGSEPHITLPRK